MKRDCDKRRRVASEVESRAIANRILDLEQALQRLEASRESGQLQGSDNDEYFYTERGRLRGMIAVLADQITYGDYVDFKWQRDQ